MGVESGGCQRVCEVVIVGGCAEWVGMRNGGVTVCVWGGGVGGDVCVQSGGCQCVGELGGDGGGGGDVSRCVKWGCQWVSEVCVWGGGGGGVSGCVMV